MTGGSSGGSGGAVAGGLVPLALGSDTNGSIRVPSSFCGIFGLKPTYGRLSRARTFPFVSSFDHLGPFARTAKDLALAYDAMQGHDADDPVCVDRAAEPTLRSLDRGTADLRIAVAGGYFRKGASTETRDAMDRVAMALDARREIEIPEAARARAAAYVITATEGSCAASRPPAQPRRRLRSGGARPADRGRDGAGGAGRPGAEIPPLVSRAGARAVRERRCHPRAGDALHRAWARAEDIRARRRRDAAAAPTSASTPSPFHSSVCRLWRRRCRSRRCRSPCRSSPRRGARTSPCGWHMRWNKRASQAPRSRISRESGMRRIVSAKQP